MTQQPPGPGTAPPPPTAPRPADPSDAPTIAWSPPRTDHPAEPPPPVEPVRRQGGGRARWGIALLVTALIVAVGVGAFVLLSGQRAGSAVVGYAPDQSVMYGELRLDLPGDQRQKLGQFLARFPGFRDQSTLDVKLDDVFDRFVRAVTEDQQDWTTKIEPWFGGQLGFSLASLPDPDSPADMRFLVVATVKDVARASAWVDEVIAEGGRTLVTETYNGVELKLDETQTEPRGALAFLAEKVLVIGDESSVRSAIDTGGNSAFADSQRYRDASAALSGDGLGFFYLDMTQYREWSESLSEELGGEPVPFADLSAQLTPEWVAFQVQARGDALAFESVSPHLSIYADENRVGTLAQQLPPATLFVAEAHEYGTTIREFISLLRQEPELADSFAQVDQVLAILGGEEGLLGWVGDAGIAIAREGEGVHGGLVVAPTDRAKAERLLTTLRGFAELGGSQAGIEVRQEDHNGTQVTILDAGDLGDLMNQGLGGAGGAGAPPVVPDILPEGRLEVAWAATDQVVVVGIGSSFVRAVLDAGPGPSLAEDARYQALIGQVGAENIGSFWADIAGIRELVETFAAAEPEALAEYEKDIKPYLLPLDAIVSANVRDGDIDRGTFIVTVK